MAARCCKAEAIVVLGCRGPAALRRRLGIGIELFERGAAPLLVLSGGGSATMPEAEIMRRAAIAHGVPPTALLVDTVSRNTVENARETARLLRARGEALAARDEAASRGWAARTDGRAAGRCSGGLAG